MATLNAKKTPLRKLAFTASSIAEVMVATVLVSIALLVVIHVFNTISTTERTPLKTTAILELNSLMHTLNQNPLAVQETYQFAGFNVQVHNKRSSAGTLTLEFECTDQSGHSFYHITKTYLLP